MHAVEDVDAIHTMFALETGPCEQQATPAECAALRSWVKATGLAFLDAYLRDSLDAATWLASADLAVASATAANLSRR